MPKTLTEVTAYETSEIASGVPAAADWLYFFDDDAATSIKLKRITYADLISAIATNLLANPTFMAGIASGLPTSTAAVGASSQSVNPGASTTLSVAVANAAGEPVANTPVTFTLTGEGDLT